MAWRSSLRIASFHTKFAPALQTLPSKACHLFAAVSSDNCKHNQHKFSDRQSTWGLGSLLAASLLIVQPAYAVNDEPRIPAAASGSTRPVWPPARFDTAFIDDMEYLRDKNGRVMTNEELIRDIGLSDGDEDEVEERPDGEDDEDDNLFSGLITLKRTRQLAQSRIKGRPFNTNHAYKPRKRHFVTWCQSKGLRPIPHSERAAAFLDWRKTNRIGRAMVLTKSTLPQNIQALQDGKKMLESVIGCSLGPDLNAFRAICDMKTVAVYDEVKRCHSERVDPQRNTCANTLTREDIARIYAVLGQKGIDPAALKYGFMMKVAMGGLFRGDDQRSMRWCDMFIVEMPRTAVGPDTCLCLCFVSREGKKNQTGKAEFGFMFMHKDPAQCPLLACAMDFFSTFHLRSRTVPDFTSKDWFDLLVWPTHNTTTKELSPEAHSDYFKSAFRDAGSLNTSKILHAFRPSSAVECSMHGASFNDITRAGRWHFGENLALAMSYIGSICADVGVILAGFGRDTATYVVPWACLEPPAALKQTLWPWVDAQLTAVNTANVDKPFKEQLVANRNFLELLVRMRSVLWQGSAFYDHALFRSEPIFNTPVAHAYQAAAKAAALLHTREAAIAKRFGSRAAFEAQRSTAMAQSQMMELLAEVLVCEDSLPDESAVGGSEDAQLGASESRADKLSRLLSAAQAHMRAAAEMGEDAGPSAPQPLTEDEPEAPIGEQPEGTTGEQPAGSSGEQQTSSLWGSRRRRSGLPAQPTPPQSAHDGLTPQVPIYQQQQTNGAAPQVPPQQRQGVGGAAPQVPPQPRQEASGAAPPVHPQPRQAAGGTVPPQQRQGAGGAAPQVPPQPRQAAGGTVPPQQRQGAGCAAPQVPPQPRQAAGGAAPQVPLQQRQGAGGAAPQVPPQQRLAAGGAAPGGVGASTPVRQKRGRGGGFTADVLPTPPKEVLRGQRMDTYYLSETTTIDGLWREFRHSGPNGLPPVVQLMRKYGVSHWYHAGDVKASANNRKNIWNRRNKPIIVELISLVESGQSEAAAISQLQAKLDVLRPAALLRSPVEVSTVVRTLSDELGHARTGTGVVHRGASEVSQLIRAYVDRVCPP